MTGLIMKKAVKKNGTSVYQIILFHQQIVL